MPKLSHEAKFQLGTLGILLTIAVITLGTR